MDPADAIESALSLRQTSQGAFVLVVGLAYHAGHVILAVWTARWVIDLMGRWDELVDKRRRRGVD